MTMNELKKKYPFMYIWNKQMGSYDYYIENVLHNANKDGAPTNAVYQKDDGTWVTLDQCVAETQQSVTYAATAAGLI